MALDPSDDEAAAVRFLQVATLSDDDDVSEGYENSYYSYLFPYVIGVLIAISVVILGLQYSWWYICKYVCGREDPIDVETVMANLTHKQRELVLKQILKVGLDDQEQPPQGEDPLAATEEGHVASNEVADTEQDSVMQEAGQPASDFSRTTPTPKECDMDETGTSKPKAATLSVKMAVTQDESSSSWGDASDLDQKDDNDERAVCPICIMRLESRTMAVYQPQQCTHKFHGACILEWLVHSTKSNNDCPICRAEVVSEEERIQATLKLMKEYPGWDQLGAEDQKE